jgi:hypothetical protein
VKIGFPQENGDSINSKMFNWSLTWFQQNVELRRLKTPPTPSRSRRRPDIIWLIHRKNKCLKAVLQCGCSSSQFSLQSFQLSWGGSENLFSDAQCLNWSQPLENTNSSSLSTQFHTTNLNMKVAAKWI